MTGYLPALAGLRGLAAVAALWARLGFVPFAVLRPLRGTDLADDLFFCLSGFLLCRTYDAGAELPGRYWRGRIFLLAPAAALFLVSGLAMPAWPALALAVCYVVAFPLFRVAVRLPAAGRAALPAGAALAFAGAVLWLESGWHPYSHGPRGVMTAAALAAVLAHGVAMFLAGACAGLAARDDGLAALAGDATVAVALALGFTLAGRLLGFNPGEFAGVAVPALVLGLAAAPEGVLARRLAAPPWPALGRLAYPLYLLFGPVRAAVDWAAPALRGHEAANATVVAGASLLAAFAASAAARLLGFGVGRNQP